MKGYIVCFILTIICTFFSMKNFEKNNRKYGIMFLIIGILLASLFCGIRDSSIVAPRDVKMYVLPVLDSLQENSNIITFFNNNSSLEKGYLLYIYIVTRFSSDIHIVLFFLQLIPSIAVFYFAYKKRNDYSMMICVLVYLLYWYMIFYTIIRQGIAVSLILLSIMFLKEKKYKRTILFFIFALLFHSSAIIGIVLYLIIYICNNSKYSNKKKNILLSIMIVTMLICMIFYKNMIYILVFNLKILPAKIYTYITDSRYYLVDGSLKKIDLILSLFCFIISIFLFVIKNKDKNKNELKENYIYTLINLMIVMISLKISNINRLGYYFFMPSQMYFFSNFKRIFKNNRLNKIISTTIIIVLLLVVWIWKYPITYEWETFPYVSDIFEFLN